MSVDLALGAVEFDAPLVNPSPFGLYANVTWVQDGGMEARWLGEGVRIRPWNYGGEKAVGVWDAPWCGDPDDTSDGPQLKYGVREDFQAPFVSATLWAYDECDATLRSQAEVQTHVVQNLRLMEQTLAEQLLAERMLADAISQNVGVTVPNLRDAVSFVEGRLAVTGTLGVVHANPELAAQEFGLVVGNAPRFLTPLGHRWVFGGGYVDTIPETIFATSNLYGWRDDIQVRPTYDQRTGVYAAIAERSVVIGYEKLVAAASFADPVPTSSD